MVSVCTLTKSDLENWPTEVPSPGLRGFALLYSGASLSWQQPEFAADGVFEGHWWTTCPLCESTAELNGPKAEDPLGDGKLFCPHCHQGEAFSHFDPSEKSWGMSRGYDACVDHCIFNPPGPTRANAQEHLRLALLPRVETTRECADADALRVIGAKFPEEVPTHRQFTGAAVWLERGVRLNSPPETLEQRVLSMHCENLAKLVVMRAATSFVLGKDSAWFTAADLHAGRPEMVTRLGCLLPGGEKGAFSVKSLGQLLKRCETRPRMSHGFERAQRRGAAGCRWRVAIRWEA